MQRTYRSMSLMLAAALALTACGHDAPPAQAPHPTANAATAPAAAPVIVNAAPAQSGMTDLLTGGALGYLLGKSSSGGQAAPAPAPSSTTVHKTIVHQTVVQAAPAPRPAAPATVLPGATPKPANTTAVTLAKPAPSYAPRSAYASTTGSSAYRAAAAPARAVTTTAPSYARSYSPPATYSGRR